MNDFKKGNDVMWFVIALFIWLGFMAVISIWGH